jgi:hypothetical protein
MRKFRSFRDQPSHPLRSPAASLIRLAPWILLPLVLLSPVLSGCGSMDDPMSMTGGMGGAGGGGGSSGPCNAPAQVFGSPGKIGKCNFCHVAGGTPPDLTTPHVTGVSDSGFSKCLGQPFINTNNRAASVILKRIMGRSCGDQMPLGIPLNAADMACVTSWVNGQP